MAVENSVEKLASTPLSISKTRDFYTLHIVGCWHLRASRIG